MCHETQGSTPLDKLNANEPHKVPDVAERYGTVATVTMRIT